MASNTAGAKLIEVGGRAWTLLPAQVFGGPLPPRPPVVLTHTHDKQIFPLSGGVKVF